jgi:hypothetical protein
MNHHRPSRFWLTLTALDAFVLGGLVAVLLVRQMLIAIMLRLVTAPAQAELLNVLDHLLPYTLGYVAAALLLLCLTLAAWMRTCPRAGGRAGLILLMALVVGALLVAGRKFAGIAVMALGRVLP